jgi:N-acetylmuramoyl-L-alanine amidase
VIDPSKNKEPERSMPLSIDNHRLVGVPYFQARLSGPTIAPEILVIHYTATLVGPPVVQAFASPSAGASAHLVLDIDGTFTQMVPFNQRAAHAGPSTWRGRPSCNGFSIGIETVNPGPLHRTPIGYVETIRRRPWTGDVVHAKHKNGGPYAHWAAYSEAQLDALEEITHLLFQEYSLVDVVGHDDIAPRRKIDPGPAFPLSSLQAIFGERNTDGGDEYRTTTILNVRSGPGTNHPPVNGSPFPQGKVVEVIEVGGNWSLVRTPDAEIEGWVFAQYLAPQ